MTKRPGGSGPNTLLIWWDCRALKNLTPISSPAVCAREWELPGLTANDPKVMLLDEPFGHLDAQTRYMMEEELEKIWQKEKRTIVFVTNNIEEAVYLADRIILLTNCPTRIKAEYIVDLPRPRSYVDPAFLKLRQEILDNTDETL